MFAWPTIALPIAASDDSSPSPENTVTTVAALAKEVSFTTLISYGETKRMWPSRSLAETSGTRSDGSRPSISRIASNPR